MIVVKLMQILLFDFKRPPYLPTHKSPPFLQHNTSTTWMHNSNMIAILVTLRVGLQSLMLVNCNQFNPNPFSPHPHIPHTHILRQCTHWIIKQRHFVAIVRGIRGISKLGDSWKFRVYSLYAWGIPCLMLGFSVFMDTMSPEYVPSFLAPGIGIEMCFFQSE